MIQIQVQAEMTQTEAVGRIGDFPDGEGSPST